MSCGHFATDATHAGELRDQHTKTTALIELRRDQYRQRTGRELTDDNVWIRERLRELHSLEAILERLAADKDAPNEAIAGAGTADGFRFKSSRPAGPMIPRSAKPTPAPSHDRHPGLAGRAGRPHPQTPRHRPRPDRKALRDLRKQNADITISSVSRRAGVTRKSIYRREDLVALIRAHRPVAAVPDDPPPPGRPRPASSPRCGPG